MDLAIREVPVVVVDIETTGLYAGADRVVEVSVVRLEPAEEPVLILDTLVNPERAVSATEIHGITEGDVADAPTFAEIAGDLARALSRAVLAAYNVYFDVRFLSDEFGRVGLHDVPPHLCLMYLRPMLELGSKCGLTDACREHGIEHHEAHTAAADALASARLWNLYRRSMAEMGIHTFRDLTKLRTYKFMDSFERQPFSDQVAVSLSSGRRFKSRSGKRVAEPAERAPGSRRTELHEYWEAVAAIVADLELSDQEIAYLARKREELRLTTDELRGIHGRVFAAVLGEALEDASITEAEWLRLRRLHECLGRLGWAPGR
jgi:DNA polymerase-3 subunit epsilon